MPAHFPRRSLYFYFSLVCILALPLFLSRQVIAEGSFISAAGRVDTVYDAKRKVVYISDTRRGVTESIVSSGVLRYSLASSSFLPTIPISGNLKGMDLSPDGDSLLVADSLYSTDKLWVHEVNLQNETVRKVEIPRTDSYEGGTFSVAFGNDGAALISSTFLGSGWTPLRRYDPRTGAITTVAGVTQNCMLSASADGSVIAFEESNISDGRWGIYRVADGSVVKRAWGDGTGWFNFEIGVNRNATQYAIPTYNGTYIYDSAFARQTIVGTYAAAQPIGQAYHPFEDKVYFPWAGGTWVREHSTTNFAILRSFDFQNQFDHTGNGAFGEGRLRIASDGSYLFGTVQGGVRYVQVGTAQPVARHQTVRLNEDSPAAFTLWGTSPTETLQFEVVGQPAHGTLDGVAPDLTYTPAPNFHGTDTVQFRTSSGVAESQVATVSFVVAPVNEPNNQPPVAANDTATVDEDGVVLIDALSNDSDPDGHPLSLVLVGQPTAGGTKIVEGKLEYRPRLNYFGTDRFTYTISDGEGGSATAAVDVTVTPVNDPPIAFSASRTVQEDSSASIFLSARDPENEPVTYQIVRGPTRGTLSGTAPNVVYTPSPNFNGPDSFDFKANDGQADSNIGTITLTVQPVNDAPVASGESYTMEEDRSLIVAAPGVLANDSDIDGDTLSAYRIGGPTFGIVEMSLNGAFTYRPTANYHGTDSFTYEARDGKTGVSGPVTVNITVTPVNDAPVAHGFQYTTNEDTPLSVLLRATDAEGDPVTFTVVAQPRNGTLSGTVPNLTYTPNLNWNGNDTLTFKANDGKLDSNVTTIFISVRPVNDAPVAAPDSYATDEDTLLSVPDPGVLGNDSDPDGVAPTAELVQTTARGVLNLAANGSFTYTPEANFHGTDTFTYRAKDATTTSGTVTVTLTVRSVGDPPSASGDSYATVEDTALQISAPGVLGNDSPGESGDMSASKETDPTHGTLTLNADGSFTYTPEANFYGTDSFTYRATGGGAASAPATVTLTVRPIADPPVALDDAASTPEDTPVTVSFLTNDTDADGDPLTLTGVTQGSNGTVVIEGDTLRYSPNLNFHGTDTLTYTITDGTSNATATVRVTVTPVNDPPTANSLSVQTDEDVPVSVTLTGSDPESTPLTYVVNPPAHGTLSGTAPNLTYRPAANYNGTDSFTYQVSDGQSQSASATVSITIRPVNDAPTAAADTASTKKNSAVTVTVLANDRDVDGDTLSVSSVGAAATGTVTRLADGSVRYTPKKGWSGTDRFTYAISDGKGGTASATVTVTVTK